MAALAIGLVKTTYTDINIINLKYCSSIGIIFVVKHLTLTGINSENTEIESLNNNHSS